MSVCIGPIVWQWVDDALQSVGRVYTLLKKVAINPGRDFNWAPSERKSVALSIKQTRTRPQTLPGPILTYLLHEAESFLRS